MNRTPAVCGHIAV